MELIGIIFGSFNLFTPIWIALGVLVGVFVYMFISQPKKNIVWKVNPNSQYGYDFNIKRETPFGLFCEGFKNQPPQRFFKYMPSMLTYYQDWKGRAQTLVRWMGIEGTAYTQRMRDLKKLDKDGTLVTIQMPEKCTLVDAIRLLWDDKFWNTVPPERRKLVEDAKIGITVSLTEKDLPDWQDEQGHQSKLVSITEDNTMSELDKEAATMKYKGMKAAGKGSTITYIFALLGGVGIGLVAAILLGWIQLAPKVSPTAPSGAGFIWWLISHV